MFLQDFKKIENCYDNVKSSFSKIASLAETGVAGMTTRANHLMSLILKTQQGWVYAVHLCTGISCLVSHPAACVS